MMKLYTGAPKAPSPAASSGVYPTGAAQAGRNAVVDTKTASPALQMLALSWMILLAFGGASVGRCLQETPAGRPNPLDGVGAAKARR